MNNVTKKFIENNLDLVRDDNFDALIKTACDEKINVYELEKVLLNAGVNYQLPDYDDDTDLKSSLSRLSIDDLFRLAHIISMSVYEYSIPSFAIDPGIVKVEHYSHRAPYEYFLTEDDFIKMIYNAIIEQIYNYEAHPNRQITYYNMITRYGIDARNDNMVKKLMRSNKSDLPGIRRQIDMLPQPEELTETEAKALQR